MTADGLSGRMTDELLPGGDFRRTLTYQRDGATVSDNVERCTPGSTPPPHDACIVEHYPATTLEVRPNEILMPGGGGYGVGSSGVVNVVVSLDRDSRVTAVRVVSTPNPAFNAAALATVRTARFRTEIRGCHPIAADYIFSVSV
jgi:TonB family protein